MLIIYIVKLMAILITEDNPAQRNYLKELLAREFASHTPVIEADDEIAVRLTLENRPTPRCEGINFILLILAKYLQTAHFRFDICANPDNQNATIRLHRR